MKLTVTVSAIAVAISCVTVVLAEPRGVLSWIGVHDDFSLGRFEAWERDFLKAKFNLTKEYAQHRPKDPRLHCPETLEKANITLLYAQGSMKHWNAVSWGGTKRGWDIWPAGSAGELNDVYLLYRVNHVCGEIEVKTDGSWEYPQKYEWQRPRYLPFSKSSRNEMVPKDIPNDADDTFKVIAKNPRLWKDTRPSSGFNFRQVELDWEPWKRQPVYTFKGMDLKKAVYIGAMDGKEIPQT